MLNGEIMNKRIKDDLRYYLIMMKWIKDPMIRVFYLNKIKKLFNPEDIPEEIQKFIDEQTNILEEPIKQELSKIKSQLTAKSNSNENPSNQ